MAFFIESKTTPEVEDTKVLEGVELLDTVEVDDTTNFSEMALEAAIEIERMDNLIMEGVGRYELDCIQKGMTAEEIYTEATFETLKEKIKKIFEYAKKWVVSLFAKFTTWLDSYVKGDLAYLKKYEKDIKANAKNLTKERTFKMGLTEEKFLAISAGKAIDLTETTSVVFRDLSTDNDKNQELLAKAKEEASADQKQFKDWVEVTTVNGEWVAKHVDDIIKVAQLQVSAIKQDANTAAKIIDELQKGALALNPDSTTFVSAIKALAKIKVNASNRRATIYCTLVRAAKFSARRMLHACVTAKPAVKESAFEHAELASYFDI